MPHSHLYRHTFHFFSTASVPLLSCLVRSDVFHSFVPQSLQTHFTTCACTVIGRFYFLRGASGSGLAPLFVRALYLAASPRKAPVRLLGRACRLTAICIDRSLLGCPSEQNAGIARRVLVKPKREPGHVKRCRDMSKNFFWGSTARSHFVSEMKRSLEHQQVERLWHNPLLGKACFCRTKNPRKAECTKCTWPMGSPTIRLSLFK